MGQCIILSESHSIHSGSLITVGSGPRDQPLAPKPFSIGYMGREPAASVGISQEKPAKYKYSILVHDHGL